MFIYFAYINLAHNLLVTYPFIPVAAIVIPTITNGIPLKINYTMSVAIYSVKKYIILISINYNQNSRAIGLSTV